MKASLLKKLETLQERYEELAHLLSSEEVINHQQKFRDYSKEYAQLEEVVNAYQTYQNCLQQISAVQAMLQENDSALKAMAEEELNILLPQQQKLSQELQILLLPRDPNDKCDIFLEIRAAAGGDEAAIFAGDLFRMYHRYADQQRWQLEILNYSEGEHGGYKSIVAQIHGQDVYAKLKFESGAHRVQRVPETEAQGRVHTSTCTVAVLPEVDEIDEIVLNPKDLKVDTFRASGAGGQHVNKTDSAIRITHLPTGLVVECQDERSQHKNRARAMSLLQARLLDQEQAKQQKEQADTRRNLVGTGDRSERIRTYNYSQNRLTDHRINLTLYKLDRILEGELGEVVESLQREYQADLLSNLSD